MLVYPIELIEEGFREMNNAWFLEREVRLNIWLIKHDKTVAWAG